MPPQPLPRNHRLRERALDAAKVDRIVGESEMVDVREEAGATAGGDGRRLRGIPAVSRGTSGAILGTDPLRAVLASGRRRGR